MKPYTVGSMLCHNCWYGKDQSDRQSWQTSIANAFENTFIRNMLLKSKNRQTGFFWIGAYRSPWPWDNDGFAWLDKTPMDYKNFAPGDPGDDDTCTLFRVSDGMWVTNDCTDQWKHGSVCEVQGNAHFDSDDAGCREAFQ
ncbi:lectin protein type III [Aphelenchoides avenae]|nr:lectin protein type III [Aphelenchus avenae]